MITLCMDTSHIFLILALLEDDQVIAKIQEPCWKRQSEEIFPKLEELLKAADKTVEDIGEVVITEGPGSYTGVRIAMTVAKVLCATKNLPIATIGTLQLYAGKEHVLVLTDARGRRAYVAEYENGDALEQVEAKDIDEITTELPVIGDGHLIGKEDAWPSMAEHFLDLKDHWKYAENVHLVKPEYLKSSDSYLVKKQ